MSSPTLVGWRKAAGCLETREGWWKWSSELPSRGSARKKNPDLKRKCFKEIRGRISCSFYWEKALTIIVRLWYQQLTDHTGMVCGYNSMCVEVLWEEKAINRKVWPLGEMLRKNGVAKEKHQYFWGLRKLRCWHCSLHQSIMYAWHCLPCTASVLRDTRARQHGEHDSSGSSLKWSCFLCSVLYFSF